MKKQATKTENTKATRLPCRGCTRKCKNYDRCEGKPWRLTPAQIPTQK